MAYKVQVISEKSQIRGSDTWTCVDNSSPQSIVQIFTRKAAVADKLVKNKFFMLIGMTKIGTRISLDDESARAVPTSGFVVNSHIVNAFNNAPIVAIAEVVTSPAKRRLSVEGTITEIGSTLTGDGWARKLLKLSANDVSLPIKVWGSKIELAGDLRVGMVVTAHNMMTDIYRGVMSLNSTPETRFEIANTNLVTKDITIDGFDVERNQHTVYDSEGNGYGMTVDLFTSSKIAQMVFPHACSVNVLNENIEAAEERVQTGNVDKLMNISPRPFGLRSAALSLISFVPHSATAPKPAPFEESDDDTELD